MNHNYKGALEWHKGISEPDDFQEWAAANESTILNALKIADEMQWQPIETAPEDGTAVRVWDGRYQYDAWFGRCPRFKGDEERQWFVDSDIFAEDYYHAPVKPTHWMPLPKPPRKIA